MADLEIVLPVCPLGKYRQRLADFKKYGLLNLKNRSVRLCLVGQTEELEALPDLCTGWPTGVRPVPVSAPRSHVAAKTYSYYADFLPAHFGEAAWYVRLDDDSVTDIDGLCKSLESRFADNNLLYLCADMNCLHEHCEFKLLEAMGRPEWRDGYSPTYHEWECCITSQSGMKRIMSDKSAMRLLHARKEIELGFTDQCLAAAARMAGLPAVFADFITKKPQLHRFSMLGGLYNHIHDIAHDNRGGLHRALKHLVNSGFPDVQNNYLLLYRFDPVFRLITSACWYMVRNGLVLDSDALREEVLVASTNAGISLLDVHGSQLSHLSRAGNNVYMGPERQGANWMTIASQCSVPSPGPIQVSDVLSRRFIMGSLSPWEYRMSGEITFNDNGVLVSTMPYSFDSLDHWSIEDEKLVMWGNWRRVVVSMISENGELLQTEESDDGMARFTLHRLADVPVTYKVAV